MKIHHFVGKSRFIFLASSLFLGTFAQTHAADKLVLQTTWYAQAEQGGYYQAVAQGIYKKYGLDVDIKIGGPQVNNMTLLLSKRADIIINYDLQVLKGMESHFPIKAIAAPFQFDPQGMVTHGDVKSLADLKGKTILVSTSGQASWWPWLKAKYNLNPAQARPYTFNLQPFLASKNVAQQGYATSEVFEAKKADPSSKFFMFANDGYPAYGGILVTRNDVIQAKPEVLQRFVKASMEGWKNYLADPRLGNALIKKENPNMPDDLLAFAVSQMKKLHLIDGGDAKTKGLGVMTDARWKATRDFMVKSGLLDAKVNWK